MSKGKIYAIYQGDKFLDLGTAEELAKKYNVKKTTIYHWARPAYKKKIKFYEKTLVVISVGEIE